MLPSPHVHLSARRGVARALCLAVLGAGLTMAPETARAAVPEPGETVDLLTDADGRVDGATTGERSGYQVGPAGDVNGDGLDDLLVGAPWADENGRTDSGSVYVLFGGAGSAAVSGSQDLAALAPEDGFRIDGARADHQVGFSVAGAGDVNDDGLDDVLIGAYHADYNGRNDSGSAYLVLGSATPPTTPLDLDTLPAGAGFRIDGATAGYLTGYSVAVPGDMNGDGIDDLAVGAYVASNRGRVESGSAYVILGGPLTPTAPLDLATLDPAAGFRIDGAGAAHYSAVGLAAAGDVDNDGRDDLMIGVVGVDSNGRNNPGAAYVVYGRDTPLDLAALAPVDGFRIDGAAEDAQIGEVIAGVGDLDGDGFDDVAVGDVLFEDGGSGATFVVYGSAAGPGAPVDLAALPPVLGFRIDSPVADANSGSAVAGAGDLNGDGLDDLAVAAPNADYRGRWMAGLTHVVYGAADRPTGLDLADLATTRKADGFAIGGAATVDAAGRSSLAVGDLNGDGIADLAIGAPYAERNGRPESGVVHLLLGGSSANRAPVAVDDSYSAGEDTALSVSASDGVLSNDTDADADPLSAVVVTAPTHGVLTLDPTGSFTYTPAPGYSGPDSFTYRAGDGTAQSAVATVVLSVVAKPRFTAPVATITGTVQVDASVAAGSSSTPSAEAVSYTWLIDDVPVATGPSFAPTGAHVGRTLSLRASFTRTGYADATAVVIGGPVAAGTFAARSVAITGTAKAGETLGVAPASTPGADSVTHEWLDGAGRRLGAGPTYTLSDEDEGTMITVVSTFVRAGYVTATGSADPVGPVAGRRAPSIDLVASAVQVRRGGTLALSWTSTRADSVAADGHWRGSREASGSEVRSPQRRGRKIYRITATNANGTTTASVVVRVVLPPTRLTVTARVAPRHRVAVTITGLAPEERFSVRLAGRRVTSWARADGTAVVRLPAPAGPGTRKVRVVGSLPDRRGAVWVAPARR